MLWTLLGAIAIAAIVALRTRTLHRHAERLRILVSERTEELQEANERLERLSMLDELTGIANRRFFQRVLHDDWKSAETLHQPVALILIDLDRFKQLNDERGHPAGDAVLSQVGRFLSRRIRRSGELGSRSGDIVARIGGEEFAILLANTGEDEAGRIGEGLRTGLEELPIVFGDATLHITASAGVAAVVPGSGVTSDQLIQSADRALYAAKAAGRNCVRVAGDEREDASAAVSS